MKSALAVCAALVALVAAGCGSSAAPGTGQSDAATLAPASTLAYASFDIAPQGAAKPGFDAAFGKLLGANPEAKLGQAFTQAAQSSGKLDYASDVKPWLGDSISLVVTYVAPRSADYALLVASTDDDKARAAIATDLTGSQQSRSYRGVDYDVLGDGTVNAVVDHFLVAGTEPAFKQIVDTSKDGNSLASSGQWRSSVGNRGDGKVGLAFVDAKALLQSLASSLPGVQSVAAPFVLGMLQLHPFVATLDAERDSLIVDVSSPGTKPDPRGPAAASSPLIESLPGDAWLAAAAPQVGQALGRIVTALKANPLIGAQYTRIAAQIRAQTGIDLERDVIATLGDLGVFVRGTSPSAVGGALIVTSPKPARLAQTLRKLPALIRSRSQGRVTVTARRSGFDVRGPHAKRMLEVRATRRGATVAFGAGAARALGQPATRLGTTPAFKKAATIIGGRPSFLVNFGPLLKLAAASPHHRNDPRFQRALPRLRHIDYIAGGARRDSGLDVLRAVLGLR